VLSVTRSAVSVVAEFGVSKCASSSVSFRSALPQQRLPLNQERQYLDHTTVTVYTFLYRRKFALELRYQQRRHPLCASTPFYHSTTCLYQRICASSPTSPVLYSVIAASRHQPILTTTRRNINHVGKQHPAANGRHRQYSHHG
jgi:hypothetical protein